MANHPAMPQSAMPNFMPMTSDQVKSPIEMALADQFGVIQDLEISVRMLAKAVDFLLLPLRPTAEASANQVGPVPSPVSPAVGTIIDNTTAIRNLSDQVEELRKRLTT